MNIFFKIIIITLLCLSTNAREKGETEITTEDGIEVYQDEKYYLLKKNVNIESDNFVLSADNVRINFENNLHDITYLKARGNVKFNSNEFKIKGSGENLRLEVKVEKIEVQGINSKLITEDIEMFSDGIIKVNNLNGKFSLKGENSKLINQNVLIIGESIDGIFSNNQDTKEISILNVKDNTDYINSWEEIESNVNVDINHIIGDTRGQVCSEDGTHKLCNIYGKSVLLALENLNENRLNIKSLQSY